LLYVGAGALELQRLRNRPKVERDVNRPGDLPAVFAPPAVVGRAVPYGQQPVQQCDAPIKRCAFRFIGGDELLVQVATRARRAVRASDQVYRLGGDEFLVVCPGSEPVYAGGLAERLREVMARPFQVGADQVSIGASVGSASSTADSTVDSIPATDSDREQPIPRLGQSFLDRRLGISHLDRLVIFNNPILPSLQSLRESYFIMFKGELGNRIIRVLERPNARY
jgi:hypothetical protein